MSMEPFYGGTEGEACVMVKPSFRVREIVRISARRKNSDFNVLATGPSRRKFLVENASFRGI